MVALAVSIRDYMRGQGKSIQYSGRVCSGAVVCTGESSSVFRIGGEERKGVLLSVMMTLMCVQFDLFGGLDFKGGNE